MILAGLLALALTASGTADVAPIVPSPDVAYITALDAYQQAELALHQGHIDRARAHLRQALTARDHAVGAYRARADDPTIRRRLSELIALDRACCGRPTLAVRLSVAR